MRLEPFSVALGSPLATAGGPIATRAGFLVGVERDGVRGIGEATPLAGWTESYEACKRAIQSDPQGTVDFESTPAAAHAVESATLDRRARAAGEPLAETLRAAVFDRRDVPEAIAVNATIGSSDVESTADAAAAAVRDGYDCLKIKAGVEPPATDVDRVRAVRDRVGESIELRVDANGAWDRPTAEAVVDELASIDIAYLEQPLDPSDLRGHASIRGQGVEIALDESLGAHSVTEIAAADAADVVICKPMAIGGPRRTVQRASDALELDLEPIVTTTIDAVVARTTAAHVAAAIPDVGACGLATGGLLADDLAASPIEVRDGAMAVPTEPGIAGSRFDSLVWD
ncbi:MAG: mandelate racemase/muconate lactonizing enzyme family protein [Halobacteriota archaeon]